MFRGTVDRAGFEDAEIEAAGTRVCSGQDRATWSAPSWMPTADEPPLLWRLPRRAARKCDAPGPDVITRRHSA